MSRKYLPIFTLVPKVSGGGKIMRTKTECNFDIQHPLTDHVLGFVVLVAVINDKKAVVLVKDHPDLPKDKTFRRLLHKAAERLAKMLE